MVRSSRVWVLGAALAAAAAAGLATPAPPAAWAGDPVVAETLFKSGKQAYQKRAWDDAIALFRKVRDEDPNRIDVVWWIASAQEKSGDKVAALASYREYQALFDGRASGGEIGKEEQRLRALADKAVDALAAAEKEFSKAEDAYVAALHKFAKDNFVRDPGIALKALGMLLDVRPDHEDALALQEKLGGPPASGASPSERKGPPVAGPFKDVKEWKDLLAAKSFKNSKMTYSGDVMVLDTQGGSVIRSTEFLDAGSDFAYEMEFRVLEVYERGWLTGLTFAAKDGAFVSGFTESGRVVILNSKSQEAQEDVANHDMAPLDITAWHRLGLVVRGPSVAVWLDGKEVASWKKPDGEPFSGELGVFQQRCRTERRVFRLGKL